MIEGKLKSQYFLNLFIIFSVVIFISIVKSTWCMVIHRTIFRSSTIMILYHRKIKTSTHFKVPDLHCSLSKWMCKQMSKQLSEQLSRQLSKGLSKRLSKQLSKRLSKRLSKLLPDQNILPRVSLKRLRDQIKKTLLNFVLKIIGIVSFKQLQEC